MLRDYFLYFFGLLSGNDTDCTQLSFPDNFAQFGNETRCTLPSVVGVFGASVDKE